MTNPSYRISVPFQGWNHERLTTEVNEFLSESGLEDYENYIRRGAFLAQDRDAFSRGPREDNLVLREEEVKALTVENSKKKRDKFRQTWHLYALVGCCSLGAAVQGWDETAVNGAQLFYPHALKIFNLDIQGLVNGAPYLCCAISCWFTDFLNYYLGRRGTIFLTCLISSLTCLWQGFPKTWGHLFVARLMLGFGVGPKSATIPIYASECAPANVRGALVMMWQMFTAFGIMCGYICGVIFRNVLDGGNEVKCPHSGEPEVLLGLRCSLNWRLMLASPMVLPLVVVAYVFTLPESPRWLLLKAHKDTHRARKRKRYEDAFLSLAKLRHSKLQAGRDLFLINYLLKEEERIWEQRNRFRELFTIKRNRRAVTASLICMFLQQFCGVNVHAYYSSVVLRKSLNDKDSLLGSMGFGIINFVFALPAVWTIDTFGRRFLLLTTFPFLALFQFLVALAFRFEDYTQKVLVLVGMYLFSVVYSPGEGPVPFVYASESMPLYNRDLGMGLVTAINWFFNFIVALTFPHMLTAFTPSGAFGFYAVWCLIGWCLILLFVPETKGLTLEQLDDVFLVPSKQHAAHGIKQVVWFVKHYLLQQRNTRKPVLIKFDHGNDSEIELGEGGVGRTFGAE